jgi:hypothetical protein
MTLQEFVDYVLTVSAQVAAEPSASPILDAQIVIEFLLPAVLREATRNAFKHDRYLESLVKAHGLTVNKGFVALPDGVEEEFARTFQVGFITDVLTRTVASVSKEGGSNQATADVGTGNFDALAETGMFFIIENGGNVLISATIEEVLGADDVFLAAYTIGVTGTPVPVGSAKLYEPPRTLDRTLTFVSKAGASEQIVAEAGEGGFTNADIGRLIIIKVADVIVIRGVITGIVSTDICTIMGYMATVIGVGTGVAEIYRIATAEEATEGDYSTSSLDLFSHSTHYADFVGDTADILPKFTVRDKKIFVKDANDASITDGTGIVLYGVTVPQVPATATEEIPIGEQMMDDCLAITSAVIRGERPIESLAKGAFIPAKK